MKKADYGIHWSEDLHDYSNACRNYCTIQGQMEQLLLEEEVVVVEEEEAQDGLPTHSVATQDCHEVHMKDNPAVVEQVEDYRGESVLQKTQQEAFREKFVMVP